ncbi:MAG TPA: hypothetical protein VMC62_02460 [Longilinea sp.]|nr:hypothetical protein [Longilinea sp.]
MATIAPVTHLLSLTTIRRTRLLPVNGEVVVHVGQKVSATDVVAACTLPGQHLLLDIGQALGITHQAKVGQYIERKPGERVQKGDVIAKAGSLMSRVVRAPADGIILSTTGGQVLMEVESKTIELKAGIPGIVSSVIPERGVVLEANGTLLQGVWGNDQAGVGILLALAKKPDEELTPALLDVSMRGAVVLGGICLQEEALKSTADAPIKGLILASMSADLIPLAQTLPFPVIVMEGFGKIPMNSMTFNLLQSSEKRDISLDTTNWDPFTGERPEIVIPQQENGAESRETDFFQAQQTVRITTAPFTGRIGTIEQLRPGMSVMPNGMHVSAAVVRLGSQYQALIPLANLEVVE